MASIVSVSTPVINNTDTITIDPATDRLIVIYTSEDSLLTSAACTIDTAPVTNLDVLTNTPVQNISGGINCIVGFELTSGDMPAAGSYTLTATPKGVNGESFVVIQITDSIDADSTAIDAQSGAGTLSFSETAANDDALAILGVTSQQSGATWSLTGVTALSGFPHSNGDSNLIAASAGISAGIFSPTAYDNNASSREAGFLVIIENAATGPALDAINGQSSNIAIDDGDTSVSLAYSNFTNLIDVVVFKSGSNESTWSNISAGASSATADAFDVTAISTATPGCPYTTSSHAIEVEIQNSIDAETASLAITRNPKSGYAVVEVASATNNKGTIYEDLGAAHADTSQVLYPTSYGTSVSTTGILTTSATSNFNIWRWNVDNGEWDVGIVQISSGSISEISFGIKSGIKNGIKSAIKEGLN